MRVPRFELSTEAFHFYGSAEVLRKSCIYTEQRRLILRKSYISREESHECFHRTAIFLRNDRRFIRNDSRYLRIRVAHKQLARTSLIGACCRSWRLSQTRKCCNSLMEGSSTFLGRGVIPVFCHADGGLQWRSVVTDAQQ